MTNGSLQDNERDRWSSVRDRERNRARFLIRERIVRQANSGTVGIVASAATDVDDGKEPSSTETTDLIRTFLAAIESGSSSKFSLRNLQDHHALLSRPVPKHLLSQHRLTEVCTSRFGSDHASAVVSYVESSDVDGLTVVEYAALLGEYDVLKSLLIGGIDPTVRGGRRSPPLRRGEGAAAENACAIDDVDFNNNDGRGVSIAALVSRRLFVDPTPVSLSAYIVKAIVEMRVWGHQLLPASTPEHCGALQERCCPICNAREDETNGLLCFGRRCHHVFCEWCMWATIDQLDERGVGDVVLCPVCNAPYTEDSEENPAAGSDGCGAGRSADSVTPSDRRLISLGKFEGLPRNTQELKDKSRKNPSSRVKNVRNAIHSTWQDAILPKLGLTQEVRRDRFFRYVERNAVHYVTTCLTAGVDVDMVNEYNQTALYVASWWGHVDVVTLLLHWGADVTIEANGGLTIYNVAKENGNSHVLNVLRQAIVVDDCRKDANESQRALRKQFDPDGNQQLPKPSVVFQTLIQQSDDHPGAGSYFVDGALTEKVLIQLDNLWKSLPIEVSNKTARKMKSRPCSKRSYFCDAEGYVTKLLSRCVAEAMAECGNSTDVWSEIAFFPHMRFLNYDLPGGWLAPHTDLVRVDSMSGRRSTHTFILYLSDCQHGGETVLLSEPISSSEVVARVAPRRGRLLLFPHGCLHEGKETISTPKVLLRGEVLLK